MNAAHHHLRDRQLQNDGDAPDDRYLHQNHRMQRDDGESDAHRLPRDHRTPRDDGGPDAAHHRHQPQHDAESNDPHNRHYRQSGGYGCGAPDASRHRRRYCRQFLWKQMHRHQAKRVPQTAGRRVPGLAAQGMRRQHRCHALHDGHRDGGESAAMLRRSARKLPKPVIQYWIRLSYRFRHRRNLHGSQWAQCSSRHAASRRHPGLYARLTPCSHHGRANPLRRVKATSSQVCPANGGHRRLRCLVLESRKGINAITHADGYAEPPSFSMPHFLHGRAQRSGTPRPIWLPLHTDEPYLGSPL